MSTPLEVGSSEDLGRHVFSRKHANRAVRLTVPHHVFLIQKGRTSISVDRLSVAPASEALALAEASAAVRDRTFYG